MNDYLAKLVETLTSIERLPSIALVFLVCIAVGFCLKRLRWFDNQYIPLVVMFMAITLTWLLAPPRVGDDPVVCWRTRQLCVGAINGFLAWAFHGVIVKWAWSKVAAYFPDSKNPPSTDGKP
jgi:hypothetical protein